MYHAHIELKHTVLSIWAGAYCASIQQYPFTRSLWFLETTSVLIDS